MPAKSMHSSGTLGLAEQAVVRGRRERAIIGLQDSACAVGRHVFFPGCQYKPRVIFQFANGCNCVRLSGSPENPRRSPFSPPGHCSIDTPQAMDHVFHITR